MSKTSVKYFKKKLEELGYPSYKQYLNSKHWKKTRNRYWNSKIKKICYICDSSEGKLFLHHRSYKRLGNERLDDLVLVHKSCHSYIHKGNYTLITGKL